MFILLVNIFDHTFNLFINNIVRKPIIDESLFYVFYLFIKYCFGGGDLLSTTKMFVLSDFFMVMLGWLRNSLAAVFS